VSKLIALQLNRWLEGGGFRLGQVCVFGNFTICHADDRERDDLAIYANPHDAIGVARYDDAGKYRPLKTAPNLRHGWRLELKRLKEVHLALDFLYPAAIALLVAREKGGLVPVHLRATLARQTGMYAVVKKISDSEAEKLIGDVCRGKPGCLRCILWDIGPDRRVPADLSLAKSAKSAKPLYCLEACNLLIAAGRKAVKAAD
jgi:sirohydrochlorin cobaltochelatase